MVLPLAAFSLLWLDLCRQLSYTWETNEQYAYGWFVPILALGLFIKKWPSRPLPGLQDYGTTGQQVSGPESVVSGPLSVVTPQWSVVGGLLLLLCLLLLPLRVIHEINQDWPLISWPYTLIVVALTLYAIHLATPPSVVSGPWSFVSPWVKHFAFPICFILVAVTWPYRIEHSLTQGLMRLDTNITVEILGWLNIPAMQRGNLIELSTGTVGVNEACSGIRSFQSTLMAALLMGELYRLRLWARASLIGFGLVLAFGFNVIRTLILAWQASAHGLSAIDKWHDPAGFTITIACFFCLWAVVVLITKRWPNTEILKHRNTETPSSAPSLTTAPWRRFALAVGLWSLLCIIATEAWYRSHEIRPVETARWWVNLPTNSPSFSPVPISAFARKLLKYDEGATGSWEESDGSKWSTFCLRWRAGDPVSRLAARNHRPEICLSGSGHRITTDFGLKYFKMKGLELPFRVQIFDAPEQPTYVFFCLWEDEAEIQSGIRAPSHSDRLSSVLKGRRGLGQQTLEIICSGYPGIEEAERSVRERLPSLVQVEKPRP